MLHYTCITYESLVDILEQKLGRDFCISMTALLSSFTLIQMLGIKVELTLTCQPRIFADTINKVTCEDNIAEMLTSGNTLIHVASQKNSHICNLTILGSLAK